MRDATFHDGELAIQERTGARDKVARWGPMAIRDHLPDEHRELFARLPAIVLGARDEHGRPQATMLAGAPGFLAAPDEHVLEIGARPAADDPIAPVLRPGLAVGLLGIEPHTRRRNRLNGPVVAVSATGFAVAVAQSFGNCPKYIQAREPHARAGAPGPAIDLGPSLSDETRARLAAADTCFLATASPPDRGLAPPHGVDVSHRGGRPGFLAVAAERDRAVITLPDYTGNFLFNTLGNLALDPAIGLLVVDYDGGGLFHLTGRATILWDPAAVRAVPGAQRLVRIEVDGGRWRPGALPLAWSAPRFAPQL